MNLYQYAINLANSSFYPGAIFYLKILQSDWLATFRPISHEYNFFRIYKLHGNIENDINFHSKPS